jgi:hypothetical protein
MRDRTHPLRIRDDVFHLPIASAVIHSSTSATMLRDRDIRQHYRNFHRYAVCERLIAEGEMGVLRDYRL